MECILVTGGAGFIGSRIVRKLVEAGHKVIVLDAFIHYINPLDSLYQYYLKRRFDGILDKVEIVRGDTRNKDSVRRTILKYKPTKIIHLAALPIADFSNVHSEEALSSIMNGTVNILEIIRDVDFIDRFVYTSSSMVYGDFEYKPADENHSKRPKEVYGGVKYSGEIMVGAFAQRYGIKYTIIRPSAVYGPTDVNRRVSQIFVENALLGKELNLHEGGETELDFTFIEDTVQGFIKATFAKEAENEVFNITRGEGRTLSEFVKILQQHIDDVKVNTVKGQEIVFRPKRGSLDISKARQKIGYAPQYSLEQGLPIYIDFVREHFEKLNIIKSRVRA